MIDTDSRTGKLLWFGFSSLIILAMIYLADFTRFVDAVRTAKPLPLAPALFFGLSVFLVWGFTWHHFLNKVGHGMKYREALALFMSGNFFNSITPLGQFGGEPILALIISRNSEASYGESLSTVLSADIINAIPPFTFVLGGGLYLFFRGSVNGMILQAVYIALVVTFIGGLLVYLLWFRAGTIENAILKLLKAVSNAIGRGKSIIDTVEQSLDKMQEAFKQVGEDPRDLFWIGTIAHLAFVFQLLNLYFIMLSMGYPTDFTPLYFVLTISFFGAFSPTPGGTGTFEALMAGTLNLLTGMAFPSAIAVAILFRLTTYWPGLLIGYISVNYLEINRE